VPVPLVIVTVPPEIVQTPDGVIVTGSSEVDVALAENVVWYAAGDGGAANVIVWLASAAVTVRTTFGAALKVALPAWDAVSVQVPVPLVIATVPPEIVQTPEGVIVTGSSEVDVALTENEVLYAAGDGGAGNVIVWLTPPTVSVKFWLTVPVLFVAVKLIGKLPLVPVAGVPPRMPVTVFIVIPLGNAPLAVNFGAGYPEGITWNDPPVPIVKLIVFPVFTQPIKHAPLIAGVVAVGGSTTGFEPATIGGNATTTSLNCFVDPPIPASTFCVGS
jgi:hypothetical protein